MGIHTLPSLLNGNIMCYKLTHRRNIRFSFPKHAVKDFPWLILYLETFKQRLFSAFYLLRSLEQEF